ncbi:MAG: triphosphoribosyl-dephospho-CoA synthase CitG [Clostridiaceae bacterium]
MLNKDTIKKYARLMARYAEEAILSEVVLSPKPGLVDAIDAGAHKDMDIYTFLLSATSLYDGFYDFAKAGLLHEGTRQELFIKIRPIGIEIEKRMFEATGNINTHKGIIFSMGIVLSAAGYYLKDKREDQIEHFNSSDTDAVFMVIREMTEGLVKGDFKNLPQKTKYTHGEILFLKYGFTGIRGEAEEGYPVVRLEVLPKLRALKSEPYTFEEKLLEILLLLMSITEDSNVVSRGGIESLNDVKSQSKLFLEKGGIKNPDARNILKRMNEDFIRKNISPGGSADLLSIAIFFGKLEKIL